MFNLGQLAGRDMFVEHRHSDGTWGQMVPAPQHHDPAQHDPERDWAYGKVFRCDVCEEEVRIVPAGGVEVPEGE